MSSTRTIGSYRLVAGLGQGGMARVFLAMTEKKAGFQKLFVLKVPRSSVAGDPEFVSMFLDEARVAARLNHPNVVHTYEVGEHDGRNFIAMEYLEGQALSTVLARVGRDKMPLAVHLRILCDALSGLQYAHDLCDYDGQPLKIVHRDVGPQNIFVTYPGQTKLLDFGIAKVANSIGLTQKGVMKGKIRYMAPEQAMAQPVDARADLFAVGVLLWEAIAACRLTNREEPEIAILKRRISGEDARVRTVKPDAPEELADICDKAMAKDPADRFASATELGRAIEHYLKKIGGADSNDVAELMKNHFAADRQKIKGLIEEQVRAAETSLPLMVLGSLLFLAGLMMFSLGLIGELLIRIYFESQGRRIYAIRDVLTQKRRTVPDEARG